MEGPRRSWWLGGRATTYVHALAATGVWLAGSMTVTVLSGHSIADALAVGGAGAPSSED
ncbi:MAG TPA: hypothetical protein VHC43_12980 [Mycobacteriales bacterium]|nr:hypothetical protein [Mycobacteriales bacterium]